MPLIRYRSGPVNWAYVLLRLAVGLNFSVYGALRLAQLPFEWPALVVGFIPSFEGVSFQVFTYAIPVVQVISGIMLCLGFLGRFALISLAGVTGIFMAFNLLEGQWEALPLRLVFFFLLYWLYRHLREDRLSFDRFLKL